MRLLLDQGLPRSSAKLLRNRRQDAVHTAEIGMSRSADEEILARARDEQRIVITLDADFHSLLARKGATSPSVIRIRDEGLRAAPLADLVSDVLNSCAEELRSGAMVTVRHGRARIRLLPVH